MNEVRAATYDDIDYLLSSSKAFCEKTPLSFDTDGHLQQLKQILDNDDAIVVVGGDPVTCHCAGVLTPSFWNPDDIICKIFTTSGAGGLQCFREVERIARERGATFLMADSWLEPRIISFYERNNMSAMDTVFLKELKDGN